MTRHEINKYCNEFYLRNKHQIDTERAIRNTIFFSFGFDKVERLRKELEKERKRNKFVKSITKVCPICKDRVTKNRIITYFKPNIWGTFYICDTCQKNLK